MSHAFDDVAFSMLSLRDFDDEALAQRVIERLMNTPKALRPERFGPYEPLRRIPDDAQQPLIDVWLNSEVRKHGRMPQSSLLLLEGPSGVTYQFSWRKGKAPSFSGVAGTIPIRLLRRKPEVFQRWLELIKDIVRDTDPVYGEIKSMALPGWNRPFDLQKRLPDIPWVSIYGEPYISFFGEEKIQRAPFLRVDRLPSGHFWLQAGESVLEPVSESKKAEIRKHFGEECFMSGRRTRYREGRAPNFEGFLREGRSEPGGAWP